MNGFKSGKQRCAEIKAARRERRRTRQSACRTATRFPSGPMVPVDYNKLMPNNSYGMSDFALRGYYVDQAFRCCDCGAECVWTAERQRWWYETAGGCQYAIAKRCRACRLRERERKQLARQASLAGQLKKQASLAGSASGH